LPRGVHPLTDQIELNPPIWVYLPAGSYFMERSKMIEQVRMEENPAVFKLTKEMLSEIDAFGRAECRTRSSAIRQLVKAGLRTLATAR
jgi:hypothetical protein